MLCSRQDVGEALDGPERNHIEGGCAWDICAWDILSAAVLYIDVRQCKGAGHFAEEGGFLVIRFDECKVDVGSPDFEGESGESGSGAEVEDAGRAVASGQLPVASGRGMGGDVRRSTGRSFASLRMTGV